MLVDSGPALKELRAVLYGTPAHAALLTYLRAERQAVLERLGAAEADDVPRLQGDQGRLAQLVHDLTPPVRRETSRATGGYTE